jgi:hypothetical protein
MPRPVTIDLYPAEVDPDGTLTYRPPSQALAVHAITGVRWLLVEYPRETLCLVALALVAGVCVWLVPKE